MLLSMFLLWPMGTLASEKDDIIQVENLLELRQQEPDGETVYEVTGEIILLYQQTFRNKKWFQDETAGIEIDDPGAGVITTTYSLGDGITGVRGTLIVYQNNYQLVPVEDPGPPSSTGNEMIPIERTLDALTADDQGRLAYIEEVMFKEEYHGTNFSTGTNYDIYDPTGEGIFRTHFFQADYINTPVPTTARHITAIVHMYGEDIQITARSLEDFQATEAYTLTFEVVDEAGEAIDDAVLTFAGEENAAGDYVVEEVFAGVYEWELSREGFRTASGQLAVEEDLVFEVMLIAVDPHLVTELPWIEAFDDEEFPPVGWNHYQLGEYGAWEWDAAAAHHHFTLDGEADNWLVSPAIQLPADEVMLLTFMERNQFMGSYGYSGVWVSDGSGLPQNEHFVELHESDQSAGELTERLVTLADYAGQIVYLAFVYQGEDAHRWWVDDVSVEPAPDVFEVPDIATLVGEGRMDGTIYRITGEVIVTHLQTAYRGQFYVQDQSGAILIDDAAGVVETALEIYDGISGFTGVFTEFQNMFQIVPAEDPGEPSSTGNTVDPMEVSLSELTKDIQGMLVVVRNVSFDEDNPDTFTHNESYTIFDDTAEGVIRTPNSPGLLDYFGTDVPDTPKDLTGVLHQRLEVTRLQPRSLDDFADPVGVGVAVADPDVFRIYPNPARDLLYVESHDQEIGQVRIINLSGQVIQTHEAVGHQLSLDVSDLRSGIYLIQIIAGENVSAHRIQIHN